MIKAKNRLRIECVIGEGKEELNKSDVETIEKISKRWGMPKLRTVAILIKRHLKDKIH